MDKPALLRLLEPHHSPQQAIHESVSHERVAGTGSRIFKNDQFETWWSEYNSLLWLHGPAGSGKTFLCSSAIEDLKERYKPDKSTGVLYFYFDANDHWRITSHNLLASLLFQTCNLMKVIPNQLSVLSNLKQGQVPSFELIFRAFDVATQGFTDVFIIIDALDECSDSHRLMALLRSIRKWGKIGLHLFLSSRKHPPSDLVSVGTFYSRLMRITDFNRNDIKEFIHREIPEQLGQWPQVKLDIEKEILAGAEGSFLWSKFVLAHLKQAHSVGGMLTWLNDMPRHVIDFYDKLVNMYLHQRPKSAELARKILIWVGYARRPLRIEEATEVLALDVAAVPNLSLKGWLLLPRNVLTICSELTRTVTNQEASESYEAVTLVHPTFRTYMDERLSSPNPHIEIALFCVNYLRRLNREDSLSSADYSQEFPLANYAARFWHYHLKEVEDSIHDDDIGHVHNDLFRAATDFLREPFCLLNWIKLFDPDRPCVLKADISRNASSISTPLYYASSLGLRSLVHHLVERRGEYKYKPVKDIHESSGTHGTALQAASYHGHVTIVKVLLESCADPFARGGLHGTALLAAKFIGHAEITKCLKNKMWEVDEMTMDILDHDDSALDVPRHIELNQGDRDPYEWRKELGHGGRGYVDMMESRASGSLCARKTMCIPAKDKKRKRLVKEVQAMVKLDHVHVVKVLGSYSIPPDFHILMDLAQLDLERYMDDETGNVIDTSNLSRWIGCLAQGLAYIHGNGVKHKNIKPSNLLVHNENILYTDIGLTHGIQILNDVTAGPSSQTDSYSAPEAARGGKRTTATDVFSLGCVYVEMLTVIAGRNVYDIFQKLPGQEGHHFRGPNNVATVKWLDDLHFGDEPEAHAKDVKVTKSMISECPERPKAASLPLDLSSQSCVECQSRALKAEDVY